MPRPHPSMMLIAAALAALLVAVSCAPAPIAAPQPPSDPPMIAETAVPADSAAPSMRPEPVVIPSAPPSTAASTAPAAVVVPAGLAAPRDIRPVGGIDFALLARVADLHVESTIAAADASLIETQVADDVRSVEHEFGMSFAGPPEIYVFGSTASYARGMASIFGYPAPTAEWIVENSLAFFEPPLGIIGVNWEAVSDRRPIAAIRHEMTHLMTLQACGSRCDLVPAWLNEGQARLAETRIAGADWRLMRVRYEAASMAATGTLLPLAGLVTQSAWNSLTSWSGYYKYQEAARVTELLREDIGGDAPIARVYERIRTGENIAKAYAKLTGRSFESFVAGLATRVRAGADAAPGVVAIATTPEGPGASYLIYGVRPSATVDVTIAGKRVTTTSRVAVSPFGAVFESLAADLPRGLYEIGVTHGGITVSARVMKRSTTGETW